MRTRTARRILLPYLGFIVYKDLAHWLAISGVVFLPLSITDQLLFGEISIVTHAILIVLAVFLFVVLRQKEAEPGSALGSTTAGNRQTNES